MTRSPTDEQINRLCAETCGYKVVPASWSGRAFRPVYPDGKMGTPHWSQEAAWRSLPGFCTDRNALQELLHAIEHAGKILFFGDELRKNGFMEFDSPYLTNEIEFNVLSIPPRQICIAALKALSKWPDDWHIDEASE